MLRLCARMLAAVFIAVQGGCAQTPLAPFQEQLPHTTGRLVYLESVAYAAAPREMPPDRTVELIGLQRRGSSANTSQSHHSSLGTQILGALIYYPVIIGGTLAVAPYMLAEDLVYEMSGPTDESPTAVETNREAIAYSEWMSGVVLDESFRRSLDEGYITALRRELGWPEAKPAGDPDSAAVRVGISRVRLLSTKEHRQALALCARALVRLDERLRDFETCRTTVLASMPRRHDDEVLRALLMEQAKGLAALLARALSGQSPISPAYVK